MRSIGKIVLGLGLVQIPMKVVSFVDQTDISFTQLCDTCQTPIKQKRYCSTCDKEVPYGNLMSGFRIDRDNIILVDKKLINSIDRSTKLLAVIEQNAEAEYVQKKCYLLMPDDVMGKPYFLLRKILSDNHKSLIIEFALRKALHLGIVKPVLINGIVYLLLKQIVYSEKIKPIEPLKDQEVLNEEYELGSKLFETIANSLQKISFSEIKDKRKEILEKVLKGEIKPVEAQAIVKTTQDLKDILKASLSMVANPISQEKDKKKKESEL
jgi:DNA end-binding protein Ku